MARVIGSRTETSRGCCLPAASTLSVSTASTRPSADTAIAQCTRGGLTGDVRVTAPVRRSERISAPCAVVPNIACRSRSATGGLASMSARGDEN